MIVAFRVDASRDIGSGHVMRCLTLADELTERNFECHFVIRQQAGDMTEFVERRGYRVHRLMELTGRQGDPQAQAINSALAHGDWLRGGQEKDAHDTAEVLRELRPDWLVVDHYGIDECWELSLSEFYRNLMVIDDLADRKHVCGVLLDQNLGRQESDYDQCVAANCVRLIGPKYSLLRREFSEHRDESLIRRQRPFLRRILISLGGVDRDNLTVKVLKELEQSAISREVHLDVVMGASAPHLSVVEQFAAEMSLNVTVSVDVADMAERMRLADLSIGAAGSTSWERCCLGLPAIMLILADNQRSIGEALLEAGCAVLLDPQSDEGLQLNETLQEILSSPEERLAEMASNAQKLCDGLGARRVVSHMERVLESP